MKKRRKVFISSGILLCFEWWTDEAFRGSVVLPSAVFNSSMGQLVRLIDHENVNSDRITCYKATKISRPMSHFSQLNMFPLQLKTPLRQHRK